MIEFITTHILVNLIHSVETRDTETIAISIPSFKLRKQVLEQLVDIIENQYQHIEDKDKYSTVKYIFKVKQRGREIETNNPTNFLSKDIIRPDLEYIKLILQSDPIKIDVGIHFDISNSSSINVEGNESNDVESISRRLEKVFDNPDIKSSNFIFHSKKKWLIYIPIGLVLAIVNAITYPLLILKIIYSISWTFLISLILDLLFGRLYPRIEIEGTKEIKIRKYIWWTIVAIGSAEAAKYILLILPH
jgi:hypothetical protein